MDPRPDTSLDAAARQLAERTREALWRDDFASQGLGMSLLALSPGYAKFAMTVRRDMLNGFGICHGGMLTTLADTAMAFASNSHNDRAVATNLAIDFVGSARLGDQLTAEAREVSRTRRTGVYDVTLTNQHGALVAVMRGRVQRMPGKPVAED